RRQCALALARADHRGLIGVRVSRDRAMGGDASGGAVRRTLPPLHAAGSQMAATTRRQSVEFASNAFVRCLFVARYALQRTRNADRDCSRIRSPRDQAGLRLWALGSWASRALEPRVQTARS